MLLRSPATFLVSLLLVTFLNGQASKPDAVPDVEFIQGNVLMVTDGDQLTVKTMDGKLFSVRLHGVDAPEPGQAYSANARKTLDGLVLGKDISVVVHRLDSQGRYMGTVFREGQDIAVKLLENGSAWHYKRVSGEQAFDVRARYAKAELKARDSKIGLWSEAMPIPPWEFREEIAGEKAAEPKQVGITKIAEMPQAEPAASPVFVPVSDSSKKYVLGPRGGCYYLNDAGEKVYVKNKSLCTKP